MTRMNGDAKAVPALQAHMASYVPRFVRGRLLERRLDGEERFWCLPINGSLVFADVSGFTAMSEKLARGGKVGAEELTRILNSYFETMIATLEAYGGDVVKFGGDAMLLLFAEGPPEECARQALSAACMMQKRMREEFSSIRTSQGDFPLRMSIGAASGPMLAASLGSAGGAEFFTFGPVVNAVAAVEGIAEATEVCADPETLRRAGLPAARSELKAPGIHRIPQEDFLAEGSRSSSLTPPAPPVEALRPYVFSSLARRFEDITRAGGSLEQAAESEHRKVTAAFLQIDGLQARMDAIGSEAALRELDSYIRSIYAKTAQADGTLAKLDLYPKGYKVMLFFGAPQAHENDEERALLAVHDIVSSAPAVYRVHAGVNTGFVFAGEVGARRRREYTIMGDAVNLAARLMSQAGESQILFGEETRRLCGPGFSYTALPPVRVKGKSEPVSLYRLDALSEAAAPEKDAVLPLWGRESQERAAADFLERIRSGQNEKTLLLIEGEAGAGKSHFLHWLAAHARAGGGWRVFYSQARAQTAVTPYRAWRHVLRGLLGIDRSASYLDLHARLQTRLAEREDLRVLGLPLFAELLGIAVPKGEESMLEPQERQRILFAAVYDCLRHSASEAPTLVTLDALDLADSSTLNMVNAMAGFAATDAGAMPLAFAASSRPCEQVRPIAAGPCLTEVLEPLDQKSLQQMISSRREGASVPLPLAEFLHRRTKGNPLFALQVLDMLEARSAVVWDRTVHDLRLEREVAEESIPDTLQGLFLGQADALEEGPRNVLKTAAVLGAEWDSGTLSQLMSGKFDLASILPSLAEKRILLFRAEGRWAFAQALLQEALYESLPYGRRRELHQRAAEFIEENPPPDSAMGEAEMAHHFYRADMHGRALPYLERSAERARVLFANLHALQLFEQALCAAEKSAAGPARMGRHHLAIARLHNQMGNLDEAMQHTREAMALFEPLGDFDSLADACALLGAVHRSKGAADEASASLARAESMARKAALPERLARVKMTQAETRGMQGDIEGAAAGLDEVEDLLRQAPDAGLEATLAFNRGTLALVQGKLKEARPLIEAALEKAKARKLLTLEGNARSNLALIVDYGGDLRAAMPLYRAAAEFFENLHVLDGMIMQTGNLATCLQLIGDLEGAAQSFRRCLLLARRGGFSALVSRTLFSLIENRTWSGRLGEAIEYEKDLESYLAESEHRLSHSDMIYRHLYSAGLHLALADSRGALPRLEALRALMESSPNMYYGDLFLLSAQRAMLDGRWDAAAEHCRRFELLPEEHVQPSSRHEWRILQGRLAARRGDEALARECFERAVRESEESAAPRLRVEALLAFSEIPSEGSRRAGEALHALGDYPSDELRARVHAARADALLAEGRPQEAAPAFAEALRLFEAVAEGIRDAAMRAAFEGRTDFTRVRNWVRAMTPSQESQPSHA
jgi:class 3 adenylate cyclase/tetratricopeptide (TPR) repeat protein